MRPASPAVALAFKGYELYSFTDAAGTGHYTWLLGTNRNKTLAEIVDPAVAKDSIEAVKAWLGSLPHGETVTWESERGVILQVQS